MKRIFICVDPLCAITVEGDPPDTRLVWWVPWRPGALVPLGSPLLN